METTREAKVECALTEAQKMEVLGLARMLVIFANKAGGGIGNIESGENWTPMEYANKVLEKLGIEYRLLPPPAERDPKALRVVDKDGVPFTGRVSKALEAATRRDPKALVRATCERGVWKPRQRGETEVRVVAAST